MDQWITDIISGMGYWGIGFLMFLENVLPPLPSELIMPLAGYTAGRGSMSIGWVIAAGTIGSVIGQFPLYYLGRSVGRRRLRRWADKHGRYLTISGGSIERAEERFKRYGPWAVLVCRLIPGVRSLISIPAGVNRMNLGLFTLYSTIGMGVWAAILTGLGYALGANYEAVEQYMGPVTYVVIGLIVVGGLGWMAYRAYNGKGREATE